MINQIDQVAEKVHAITAVDRTPVQEGLSRAETGVWPIEFFDALLSAMDELPGIEEVALHHIGYLLPSREVFDAATEGVTVPVIQDTLVDPSGHTHHRKYIRVPNAQSKGNDTFLEFALLEEGDGRYAIHFDFIHPNAEALLQLMKEKMEAISPELNADVLYVNFGGGNAPVGKVGLRPKDNPHIDVGIMFRTHYSDPVTWGEAK